MSHKNIARASVAIGLALVSFGLNGCGRMGPAPAAAALAMPGPLGGIDPAQVVGAGPTIPDQPKDDSAVTPVTGADTTASASASAAVSRTVTRRVFVKRVKVRKVRVSASGKRRVTVRRVFVKRVVRRTTVVARATADADLKGNLQTSLLPPPPPVAKAPEATEPAPAATADPAQTAPTATT